MSKYYYSNGFVLNYLDSNYVLHREDGPAIEHDDGRKEWCQNGKWHRLDGPAIDYPGGSKYWYQNGLRHRLDGPAMECWWGRRWFINGKQFFTEEEFLITKLSGLLDG